MSKSLKIACIADTSKTAQTAYKEIAKHYSLVDAAQKRRGSKSDAAADVIVVLGGDGFMLQTMHQYMARNIPFYGMNCGTVGFLLNSYSPKRLLDRIDEARCHLLHPLRMYARNLHGKDYELLAINEVSLFRQTRQAAKIRITVDHVVRIPEMTSDGVLVATPAGSTAYNSSAGGPIIPLDSNIIALTPLSPFRPRNWKGALLSHHSSVTFEVLDPKKRPVSAVADFTEIRDVVSVAVHEHQKMLIKVLFDPERNLEERIIKEQFM
jgi:NAD+ kinase